MSERRRLDVGLRGDEGEPPGAEEPYEVPPGPEQAPRPGPDETLREFGQMTQVAPGEPIIHCLSIVGQIEGHVLLPPKHKTTKYEHIMPQLVAVEQNPRIKGLLVLLNTVGGDIEAGLAIAEMVASLSKPTVSLVLGGGHSIGIPIAVASDYSFIAKTATMTIHPIRLNGLVIGVPQTYEYLDKMQDRVIRFITEHSGMEMQKLRELMFRTGELMRDVGTVLVGAETVQVGLIDAVGGVSEALTKLLELIGQREGLPGRERRYLAEAGGRTGAPRSRAPETGVPGPRRVSAELVRRRH